MAQPTSTFDPTPVIAQELGVPPVRVAAVVALLTEGATVPFIARYRKEVTGEMDEVQIRTVQERHAYLMELEDRRQKILVSIEEQGKLSPELEAKIRAATTKTALEDLYLPYKPKRRTRATIAREKGLQPLADLILAQPTDSTPLKAAWAFVDAEKGVEDVDAALAGARDIVAEALSEHAELRAFVRETLMKDAFLVAEVLPEKANEPTKFEQWYNFREAVAVMPSHRFLAIRRGEVEGVLKTRLEVDEVTLVSRLLRGMGHQPGTPWAGEMAAAVEDGWKRLLFPSVETEVRVDLKMRADRGAVDVFAENLKNLLLAPLLGSKRVVGIDPGLRTGCKCVAVDETGRFLENITIYLVGGARAEEAARRDLAAFVKRHHPFVVAVGNGTGGRETESFARAVLGEAGMVDTAVVAVSESGASVYSASDVAREEFPDLDLTIRGAISIARRLQDPLAELVKIDPKAIGVGQYQHDVFQSLLARKLDEVVEDCVNHVGVELNTASAPLLARVAGFGPSLAKKVVAHREKHGAFKDRASLLDVSGLGPRTFEQAAGFLRLRDGAHPLDASAVHPERYGLVERMASDLGVGLKELVGSERLVGRIDPKKYVGGDVGEPTLKDILAELQKPGRDPRETFEPPKFRDDVREMGDLKVGMELEGIVTNVTAFGAFVDVGVHQDGLVHISQLSDRFVKDAAEVVKVGDKLKVRVLEVDVVRKRISLTAKSDTRPPAGEQRSGGEHRPGTGGRPQESRPGGGRPGDNRSGGKAPPKPAEEGFKNNPFASALAGITIKKK